MERFRVSKCLPVPENGMHIELFAVNYSDFDFRRPKPIISLLSDY